MGCATSFESRNKTQEDEMSLGYRVVGFDKVVLSESEILNASFVRATGSSGTIQGHYYNIEVAQVSATRS